VHVSSIKNAGGFTITSTPDDAIASQSISRKESNSPDAPTGSHQNEGNQISTYPYLELAVQDSPTNPPAAWLWKPEHEILDQALAVRVGGRFVWPPLSMDDASVQQIEKVVFVAGGVGIK
jgi:hypothetical protein